MTNKLYILVSPIRRVNYIWRPCKEGEAAPRCSPSRQEVLDEEATTRATRENPMKGIHLSTAHLREDCGYLRKAGQPDSRVVEVEADNPLILGLTICKKCQVLVGGEVAELETLMAL